MESDNDTYTGANVAAIVLGGLILILAIVGTFLPKERSDVPPDSGGGVNVGQAVDRRPDAVASRIILQA